MRVASQLPIQTQVNSLDRQNPVFDHHVPQLPPLPLTLCLFLAEIANAEFLSVVLGGQGPETWTVDGHFQEGKMDFVRAVFVAYDAAYSLRCGRNVTIAFHEGFRGGVGSGLPGYTVGTSDPYCFANHKF